MDTKMLVNSAKNGDKDSLVQLIMLKKEDYYKLAYVYMKNPEDAMDAMEDMILIIYENIHSLRKEDAFYSWSKSILVNCCKSLLNKKKKIIFLDSMEEESYNDSFDQKNNEIIIENGLSQLSEKHKEVIKLRYFLDLDYKTISDIIKVPVGTVRSRLSIGLKKLKEILGGDTHE